MPDNLQFDQAEQTGAISCKVCGRSLPDQYHVVNGHIVCDTCRRSAEADWNRGGAAGRFGKALGLGILAAIGCAVLWYVVLKLTDSQFGILAIVVGFVVGTAVHKGANGRGGWRYQALAIFLTYTAIVSSYVPFIVEGFRERSAQATKVALSPDKTTVPVDSTALTTDSTARAATASTIGPLGFVIGVVVLVGVLYASPFLMGQSIIGILIIGFALYMAWKINRRTELSVSGPHQVSTSGAPA
jgi:hypothetical protein